MKSKKFSQTQYIIVHSIDDTPGPPRIEGMHLTAWEAEWRARSLASAYSKSSYPKGLIVLPCTVIFKMPDA
jgi:hypothetical protein